MRHVEAQAQAGRTASGHLFLPQFASIGAQAAGGEDAARAREYTRD
jgi:hypothetical protein